MKKTIVGTGITKRVQVSYETPEEQYAYLKKYFSRTFDFEHLVLQRMEKEVKDLLRAKPPSKVMREEMRKAAENWQHEVGFIRAQRERNPDMALRSTYFLGQSFGAAVEKWHLKPLADRGAKFPPGSKKGRQDALGEVLARMLPATNKEVFDRLEVGRIIQEVDHEENIVFWRNQPGIEKKTSFKRIKDRLTTLRKKFPPNKIHK